MSPKSKINPNSALDVSGGMESNRGKPNPAPNLVRGSKTQIRISDVHFIGASPEEVKAGLKGWVRCQVNHSIVLDNLALRSTRDGRLILAFPGRRDSTGTLHYHFRPKDDATRRQIETQIFQALGIREE